MKSVIKKLILLAGVVLTASAWGQASVTVGTASALPGATGVIIPVNLTAGDDIAGITVVVLPTTLANYINLTVSCAGQTVGANTSSSCVPIVSGPNAGGARLTVNTTDSTTFVSGLLGNITFDVPGTATPLVNDPLVATVTAAGTPAGVDIDPLPTATNGSFTVLAGPQPAFGVTPASVTQSGAINTTISSNVVISNTGAAGSTLNYSCTETADASNKFTISGDITNVNLAQNATATVAVACDSSVIGGPFTGTMSCTHNGTNSSPVDIPLSCEVTAGPQPAFTGTPAGLTMSAGQGDPDPSGSLAITNSGAATTTLTGTCTLAGDTEISVTNGGFSVVQGAPAAVVGVACDASAHGTYNSTLSCSHNGSNSSPVDYAVSCVIAPPGAAVFQSSPAAGSTIEMTPEDVPVDAVVPDQVLTITNGAVNPNNNPLNLSCAYTGSSEISVLGPISPIGPMGSSTATFSCDTAAVGNYTGTYTCNYSVDGSQTLSETASYTVNCGVRAAESSLDSSPGSGSTLNMSVPMGGSSSAFINIFETNDEGEDATINSCTLTDGTNFTILTTFPMTVPAGGTMQIQIEGTDPGDGNLNFTDTITCSATDSGGTSDVSWDLNMSVQTTAIPTLSTWGLLAMFLTMLGLGGIALRRKTSS